MNFLKWLTGSTPGGMVGEAAGTAGAKVLEGFGNTVKGFIEEFHLPPEKAQAFLLEFEKAKLEYDKAAMEDIQSARAMQMATHSFWPGVLTLIQMVGFYGVMFYGAKYGLPDNNVWMMLLGTLASGYGIALTFWLGSSRSSQAKDMLLYQSQPSGKNGNGVK